VGFPYIFEEDFEGGTKGGFDTETDTGSQLDYPSYRTLASTANRQAAPYRGSHCMRIVHGAVTTAATLTEGDVDIALGATRYVRFYLQIPSDFSFTATDTFPILELQGAADAVQIVVGLLANATTGLVNIGIGNSVPTAFWAVGLRIGVWYCVEVEIVLDSGAGNDGTAALYVSAEDESTSTTSLGTGLATMNQIAVTHAVLGTQDTLATTTGTLLFDEFAFDDARLHNLRRWDTSRRMTKSGHAVVGPGKVSVSLAAGGAADNVLRIYDTDTADTNQPRLYELRNSAADETVESRRDIYVRKGAYIELSGTNPQAFVEIQEANVYGSTAAYRNYGLAAR
jgi:hypothetical protein